MQSFTYEMMTNTDTRLLSSSPSAGPGRCWSAGSVRSCHFSSAYRCGPERGGGGERQRRETHIGLNVSQREGGIHLGMYGSLPMMYKTC